MRCFEAINGPFPVHSVRRRGAIRFLSMMFQMLDRLSNEDRALLPGAIFAEQGNERRLPGMRVLAQPLACDGFVAGMVEQVIGNLECQSDVAGEAAVWRSRIGRKSPHDARRLDGELDEGSVLSCCSRVIEPMSRSCPPRPKHLAPGHPVRAGRAGHLQYQLGPDERIFAVAGSEMISNAVSWKQSPASTAVDSS